MATDISDSWTEHDAALALKLYQTLRPNLLKKSRNCSTLSLAIYLDLELSQETNKNSDVKKILNKLGKPSDDVVNAMLEFAGLDPEAKIEGVTSVSPAIKRAWDKQHETPKKPVKSSDSNKGKEGTGKKPKTPNKPKPAKPKPAEPKPAEPKPAEEHYLKVILNDYEYKAASWKDAFTYIFNRIDTLDRDHLFKHYVGHSDNVETHTYELVDYTGNERIRADDGLDNKQLNLYSGVEDTLTIIIDPVKKPKRTYSIYLHSSDNDYESALRDDNIYESSFSSLANLLHDFKPVNRCVIMHMIYSPISQKAYEEANKEPIILKASTILPIPAPSGNGTPANSSDTGTCGDGISKIADTQPIEPPEETVQRLSKPTYLRVFLNDLELRGYCSWKVTFISILKLIAHVNPSALELHPRAHTPNAFLCHLVERGFNIYKSYQYGYGKISIYPHKLAESERGSCELYNPVKIPNTYYYIDIHNLRSSLLLLADIFEDLYYIDRCIITQVKYNPTKDTFYEERHPIVLKIPPPIHLPTPQPDNLTPDIIEAVAQDKDLMTVRQARYRGILHPDGIVMFLANHGKKWGCFEKVTGKYQYDALINSFKNNLSISASGIIIGREKDFKAIGYYAKPFSTNFVLLANENGAKKARKFYYLNYEDFQRNNPSSSEDACSQFIAMCVICGIILLPIILCEWLNHL